MKPSERIKELAKKFMNEKIDPGFYHNRPQIDDYLNALVEYLDEEYEKTLNS